MRLAWAFALCLAPSLVLADKKPLDHSVYDGWNSIRGAALSHDGKWLLYVVTPQEGDATVVIKSTADDGSTITFPRGVNVRFTRDSRYVVATQIPPFLETRDARRKKAKPEDMPKSNLAIVDLAAKSVKIVDKVASYQMAPEDSGWVLYKPEPPKKPADAAAAPKPADPKPADPKPAKKADHKPGDPFVLLQLATGKEERLEDVSGAEFDKHGDVLAYATSTKDGKGDGVVYYDLARGTRKNVVTALGHYPKLALSNDGANLAFTTDKDDYSAKKPTTSLYLYEAKRDRLQKISAPTRIDGFGISEFAPISFSESGRRLLFGTGPKPVEDKEVPDDEKVNVEIWTTQDPLLQPQQTLEAARERQRSYLAVYFIDRGEAVQLETPQLQNVTISDKGDGGKALGIDSLPYRQLISWDGEYQDAYVVDVASGRADKVLTKFRGPISMSPRGRFVAAIDETNRDLVTIDTSRLRAVRQGGRIPASLTNELNDVPNAPDAYGFGGWTKDDGRLLVYDRFDVWSVDPTGVQTPVCATTGAGRLLKTRFRIIDLDADEPAVPEQVLLSAFDVRTKRSGFYRADLGKRSAPQPIVMADKIFGTASGVGDVEVTNTVIKAKDADVIAYTREDEVEFPNVWVSDLRFDNPRKMSDANPQQKDYNWVQKELVRWRGNDGQELEGILIKPENFDPTKKYPMITYFYERYDETLHKYIPPAPSASTINLTLFPSQGYLVFVPDVRYQTGHPGQSALSCILPGINGIVARGYVDPKRLAIQGQSWGGYEVAYLVTATHMFACAEAGAPVANMTSAYGGIRYGAGVVRQMQYEHGQSRIGAKLWDALPLYLENSPLFNLDRVQTPLMIMSNDQDGAVPHTQGIELFTAMRRLGKPCWMVVYNGEDHNIMERKNRKDFSIRLSQFFDHFLKGAPMPEWMAKGIPAVDKGRNMGLGFGGK